MANYDKDKAVQYNDTKLKIGSNNEQEGSTENFKSYTIQLQAPTGVVILHPSFLCPAIKNPDEPLVLYVLADKIFHDTFNRSKGKNGNLAGPSVGGTVNRYLKIVPWNDIDKSSPADKPLFSTNAEAMDNIDVYYLWHLNDLKDRVLKNAQNTPFGMIHPKVMDMYKNEGLEYGFEIVIQNFSQGEGLYDVSWMHYVRTEDSPDGQGFFFEMQDELINDYNRQFRQKLEAMPLSCSVENDAHPVFTEEESTLQSYHPVFITSKPKLDIGHLSDVHVSSRHTVFTKSKARIVDRPENDTSSPVSDDIGPLVNTSYSNLKNLMTQLGNEVDLLIFTGDLIDYNRNFNPNNSENGIDSLNNSAQIWSALNLDELLNKKRYPPGIDNLVIYELFKWYYKTFNKPILLISGNHEAYTLPYGISPRAKLMRSIYSNGWLFSRVQSVDEVIRNSIKNAQKDKEEIAKKKDPVAFYSARANEGIPADHNLTITEAILMYGPDYARLVMDASSDNKGKRGFKPQNLEWFYKIFTPLSSFAVLHGDQSFIGLEWGEDERIISPTLFKQGYWSLNGFLPRSTDGVSDSQLKIIDAALKQGKSCNVLCTHFTFVNFNNDRQITETGEVNYNSWTSHGKFDYGTFEKNRSKVYQYLIDKKIQYTLSGHSHRSGLYQVTDGDTSIMRSNLAAQGQAATFNAQGERIFKPKDDLCRIMVVGCGGPVGVQNHKNEFYNWGLDSPTGHYITFSGTSESKVGVKVPEIPQSKPRLAVALDYADIFLRDDTKKGLFTLIESELDDGPFNLTLHEDAKFPEKGIFDKAVVYAYQGDTAIQIEGKMSDGNKDSEDNELYNVKFPDDSDKLLKKSKRDGINFIKFVCNGKTSNPILESYNRDSDWIYPISIINRKDEAIKQYEESLEMAGDYDALTAQHHIEEIRKKFKGFTIERHETFGEVPDFDWYTDNFGHEYL